MKKFHVILIAGLFICSTGCTKENKNVPIVEPLEVMGLLQNDFAVLVDVREQKELESDGIAQKARWIATSKIEQNSPEWQDFIKTLPKDKQIIFYCVVGVRAKKAALLLAERGYRVGIMKRYSDWVKAGLPIKKEALF